MLCVAAGVLSPSLPRLPAPHHYGRLRFKFPRPGFELPVSLLLAVRSGLSDPPLSAGIDQITAWLELLVRYVRDPGTGQFSRGSSDTATAASRLYEAIWLGPVVKLRVG